jgi:hypothetical protein
MKWSFRPGAKVEEQLKELEDVLGIQNLRDVSVKEDTGNTYLYIYTDTKTYRTLLTEV